jgi:hypothetical protein
MIKVSVRHDLDKLIARVSGWQRSQIPFATAKALTKTAGAVQQAIPRALEEQLDRPTPFTKRGTFIVPARKSNLQAVVGFKDRQAAYMAYQIEGGTRAPTKKALRLPGEVVLNEYGNIPKDTIKRLIAAAKSGKLGAVARKRLGVGDRRKGAGDLSLFYGQPKGHPGLPVGIWRRMPGTPGKLVPVIVFPKTVAHYKPRFRFRALVERVVRDEFPRQFAAAFDEAIRTAR